MFMAISKNVPMKKEFIEDIAKGTKIQTEHPDYETAITVVTITVLR